MDDPTLSQYHITPPPPPTTTPDTGYDVTSIVIIGVIMILLGVYLWSVKK